MEQLRVWAERFRRHGRLKEEEMETIIEEMKKEADNQGEKWDRMMMQQRWMYTRWY
jgi:hypothetical protein